MPSQKTINAIAQQMHTDHNEDTTKAEVHLSELYSAETVDLVLRAMLALRNKAHRAPRRKRQTKIVRYTVK